MADGVGVGVGGRCRASSSLGVGVGVAVEVTIWTESVKPTNDRLSALWTEPAGMETLTVPELLKLPESMNSTVWASIQVRLVAWTGFAALTPLPERTRSSAVIVLGLTDRGEVDRDGLAQLLSGDGAASAERGAAGGERGGRHAERAADGDAARALELEGADVGRAGAGEAPAGDRDPRAVEEIEAAERSGDRRVDGRRGRGQVEVGIQEEFARAVGSRAAGRGARRTPDCR